MKIICLRSLCWPKSPVNYDCWYGSFLEGTCLGYPTELKHTLSKAEVEERRNNNWRSKVRVGEFTDKFSSSERLVAEAIKQFKTSYPNDSVLVCGHHESHNPRRILVGPKDWKEISFDTFGDGILTWRNGKVEGICIVDGDLEILRGD